MPYMCIKVWNEHVLQDKWLPMPNISYERAHTNHRITSEWELMSSLNRSLAWLAAIKQYRIENTLAHDLPFRENDSLVFIWLALNRQITVAVMVTESERDLWKNKRQSCSFLAWFHKDWWDGKRVGRAAGSNGSSRAQWSAALHWLVFWHGHSPGPYRSSWNLNHHLWLLAPLGKRGWLTWMDWCQQAFYVGLHAGRGRLRRITGDLCRRPKINIPWSDG